MEIQFQNLKYSMKMKSYNESWIKRFIWRMKSIIMFPLKDPHTNENWLKLFSLISSFKFQQQA